MEPYNEDLVSKAEESGIKVYAFNELLKIGHSESGNLQLHVLF